MKKKLSRSSYVAGRLSAGALGFVHGNLKGARIADSIFTKQYSMAPSGVDTRRGSASHGKNPITPVKTPSKKRRGSADKGSRKRSKSIVSIGGTGTASGKSDRQANSKHVSGKVKAKGRKEVKITKDFILKVRKANDPARVRGHFQSNEQNVINPTLANQQTITINIPSAVTAPQGTLGLFAAARVLHAASRCWNGKTAVIDPVIGGGGAAALNLNEITTVVDVRKQWWVHVYRNNAPRTVYVKVFKCQPKSLGDTEYPLTAWSNALTSGIAQGYVIGTPAITVNTLFTSPSQYREFNAFFRVEQELLTIEPGQSYILTIPGPAMEYDMKKFYINSVHQRLQKHDIFLMHAVYTDLIGVNASTSVQRAPFDPAVGELIVESRYYCEMSMPETVGWQSGGVVPAAGAVQNINRVMRFVVDDFTDKSAIAPLAANQDRTDMENPI